MRVPWAHSLKERRQVALRVLHLLGKELPIAVADLSSDEDPRALVIGLAAVGNAKRHVEGMMQSCLRRIEQQGYEVSILESGER